MSVEESLPPGTPQGTLEQLRWKKFPVLDQGFVCLVDMMGSDQAVVQAARVSYGQGTRTVSDDRTRATLRQIWDKFKLLLEPHGAVAWRGFEDWLKTESLGGGPAVILETANPAKFPEEIERMMGWSPDIPPPMEIANKLGARFVMIVGDNEMAAGRFALKNMTSGEQLQLTQEEIAAALVVASN